MFEKPRSGRQARNFTTNVPKILDLKSSSQQIFFENCRWVPCCFTMWLLTGAHSRKPPALVTITFSNFRGGPLRELRLSYAYYEDDYRTGCRNVSHCPIQDYVHPDYQTQPTQFEMTPEFKPFTVLRSLGRQSERLANEYMSYASNVRRIDVIDQSDH